jgi:Arf-GAP/coiled-coil/ANK repeat/PH domain-containing protein
MHETLFMDIVNTVFRNPSHLQDCKCGQLRVSLTEHSGDDGGTLMWCTIASGNLIYCHQAEGGALSLGGVIPLLGMGVKAEKNLDTNNLSVVLRTANNKFVCSLSESLQDFGNGMPPRHGKTKSGAANTDSIKLPKEQTYEESIFSWYICINGWVGIAHNKIQSSYSKVFATQADWGKTKHLVGDGQDKHKSTMGRLFAKKKKEEKKDVEAVEPAHERFKAMMLNLSQLGLLQPITEPTTRARSTSVEAAPCHPSNTSVQEHGDAPSAAIEISPLGRMVLMEDSPMFRSDLGTLNDAVTILRKNYKSLLELIKHFLKSGRDMVEQGRKLSDGFKKLAPANSGLCSMPLIGFDEMINLFVTTFSDQLLFDEVRFTQLEEAFVVPLTNIVSAAAKEAKLVKQRFDKMADQRDDKQQDYLKLPKESEMSKAQGIMTEYKKLEIQSEELRVAAVANLQDVLNSSNIDYVGFISSWSYQHMAYLHHAQQAMNKAEPTVASLTDNVNESKRYLRSYKDEVQRAYDKIHMSMDHNPMLETFQPKRGSLVPEHGDIRPDGSVFKEGYLMKKSTSGLSTTWKRRWFTLEAETNVGRFYYRGMGKDDSDEMNLQVATVRIPDSLDKRFVFEVICRQPAKTYTLQASDQADMETWRKDIEHNIGICLGIGPASTINSDQSGGNENDQVTVLRNADASNGHCADCGAPNPEWVSLNLCGIICIECAGIHRSLGTHITKMRGLTLDSLAPSVLSMLISVGNEACNRGWSGGLNGPCEIDANSPRGERERWIKRKYVSRDFVYGLPEDHDYYFVQAAGAGDCALMLQVLIHPHRLTIFY